MPNSGEAQATCETNRLAAEAVPRGAARPFLNRRFVTCAIAAAPAHVTFMEGDTLAGRLEAMAQQAEGRENACTDDKPGARHKQRVLIPSGHNRIACLPGTWAT